MGIVMENLNKESFRILARASAQPIDIQELSDNELAEVSGGGQCISGSVTHVNGSADGTLDYDLAF
jgi:bacteriocin-like protein